MSIDFCFDPPTTSKTNRNLRSVDNQLNAVYYYIWKVVGHMSEFGKLLKTLRVGKEISQRKLAELVGIDFTYISKIENGTMEPPAEDKIVKIAEVLGEDPDKMLIAAKKVPRDFQKVIAEYKDVPILLRKANSLSPKQWEDIRRIIDDKE